MPFTYEKSAMAEGIGICPMCYPSAACGTPKAITNAIGCAKMGELPN